MRNLSLMTVTLIWFLPYVILKRSQNAQFNNKNGETDLQSKMAQISCSSNMRKYDSQFALLAFNFGILKSCLLQVF